MIEGIDHDLVRRVAASERKNAGSDTTGDNVFTVMRRIGQAKAGLAADYAAQLARNVGKVVFFAKHVDVMDAAERTFAQRGVGYASIRGDQTLSVRKANIERSSPTPRSPWWCAPSPRPGCGPNPGRLQRRARRAVVDLGGADAGHRLVHWIGQTEPVTAWRIIATQTIDPRLAQLIDDKAGLAARALDGSDEDVGSSADVQLEALISLLTEALHTDAAVAAGPLAPRRRRGDASASADRLGHDDPSGPRTSAIPAGIGVRLLLHALRQPCDRVGHPGAEHDGVVVVGTRDDDALGQGMRPVRDAGAEHRDHGVAVAVDDGGRNVAGGEVLHHGVPVAQQRSAPAARGSGARPRRQAP